jgi:DNA-binding LytR/AlgR family response regulator
MMPSALIVEDEPLLRQELADHLRALWPELEIAGHAENGIEAISMMETLQPDIVFLDIQMPGLNGMEVALHVPETTQIVFVTAYAEYAVQAFEAGAADYLVKPVNAARLMQTIKRLKTRSRDAAPLPPAVWQKVFANAAAAPYMKWIKASVGSTVRLLMVSDVLYFQSDGKYTRVVTATDEALIRLPLKSLAEQLDPAQFTQIHRGAIVNLEAVDRIERDRDGNPFGGDGVAGAARALAAQVLRDELAGVDHLVEVDAGLDAQAIHHVQHVFGGDVAGRALGVRAAAQARHRRVEDRHAHFQAGVDVRQRLAVGIVEVAGHAVERNSRAASPSRLGLARRRDADGVGDVDLVAAQVAHAAHHVGHRVQRHLALVGAAEGAADAAAQAQAVSLAAFATASKRAIDSAIEQLMFFCEKASEAEPKITTSSAFAASAASKPCMFGVSAE